MLYCHLYYPSRNSSGGLGRAVPHGITTQDFLVHAGKIGMPVLSSGCNNGSENATLIWTSDSSKVNKLSGLSSSAIVLFRFLIWGAGLALVLFVLFLLYHLLSLWKQFYCLWEDTACHTKVYSHLTFFWCNFSKAHTFSCLLYTSDAADEERLV